MRIAFFTPSLSLGGYEKVVLNYANELVNKHDIYMLCGKAEGYLKNNLDERINLIDLKARTRSVLYKLTRWLRHNDPDILYVPFVTYTMIAVWAKKISRSRVCIYGVQHGFEKRYHSVIEHIIGKIVSKADVLAAVSRTVADYDADRLGIENSRYYILDNPVISEEKNTITINSDEWMKKHINESIFAVSGRLAHDKHVELIIEMISKINESEEANLIILGDGPERLRLEKMTKNLNLEEKVYFAGFVKNPLAYLEKCRALMLASEKESFGNAVVEALYAGIPVITTNCGGPVEIIEKNRYGITIGSYDDSDIVNLGTDAALKIIRGQVHYRGLREKAKTYDVKKVVKQFLEPYYEWNKENKKRNIDYYS